MWNGTPSRVTGFGHGPLLAMFVISAMGFLLAGCETSPDAATFADTLVPASPPPAAVAPVSSATLPVVAVPPARKARQSVRVTPRPTPPRPAAVRTEPPPELVGLDERQLTALLGAPTAESSSGPGKHLLYRLHHCAFDLSLYPNVDTHTFHLLSYEVTDDDRSSDGKKLCQAKLAERVRNRQARARDD